MVKRKKRPGFEVAHGHVDAGYARDSARRRCAARQGRHHRRHFHRTVPTARPVLRADPSDRPTWIVKDGRAYRPPRVGQPIRNKAQTIQYLGVLIAAFEEVDGFDPSRRHNGTPPALWIEGAEYLQDVKALLGELRRLNDFLSRPRDQAKAEQSASLVVRVTTKFVESYAGALGKGAAALTVGAAATLLLNIGVDKGMIEPIWAQLKGK